MIDLRDELVVETFGTSNLDDIIEQLEEWGRDGGCEATDGCWVEPDGVCQHRKPSWMIALGLL
jgi:hypothetical protein